MTHIDFTSPQTATYSKLVLAPSLPDHPTRQLPQTCRLVPPGLEGYRMSFRPASRHGRATCSPKGSKLGSSWNKECSGVVRRVYFEPVDRRMTSVIHAHHIAQLGVTQHCEGRNEIETVSAAPASRHRRVVEATARSLSDIQPHSFVEVWCVCVYILFPSKYKWSQKVTHYPLHCTNKMSQMHCISYFAGFYKDAR